MADKSRASKPCQYHGSLYGDPFSCNQTNSTTTTRPTKVQIKFIIRSSTNGISLLEICSHSSAPINF